MERSRKSIQYQRLTQNPPLANSKERVSVDKYQPTYPDYIVRKIRQVVSYFEQFIFTSPESNLCSKWQPILPTTPIGYRRPILVAENDSFGIPTVPFDWMAEWQNYSYLNRAKNYFWTQISYFAPNRIIPGGVSHVKNLPLLGVG